jgi:hydrogenase expression/formation protein HypE
MMEMGKHIMMAHGGGGQLMDELLAGVMWPRLGNPILGEMTDSGIVSLGGQKLALTLDGYVVQPIRFPGGDIGRIAVSGTVNDLAVCGAKPLGLALGLVLAEGLEKSVLEGVVDSIAATAREAGVQVVTGDTKVVGRGQADGIYITTAGMGVVREGVKLSAESVKAGDVVLINGPIADHGLAVMVAREMPQMASSLMSDVAPLNGLIEQLLGEVGDGVVFMRDPTRGGLAGVAADLAKRCGWHVTLEEERIPVRPATRHAAEMLGLDPLDVANEGKVVVVVREGVAERALRVMKQHERGVESRVIGRVEDVKDGLCELHTVIGGRRIVQKPYGEQLPRIC